MKWFLTLFFFCYFVFPLEGVVQVGSERLFTPEYAHLLKGKTIGLVTNHTAIDSLGRLTSDLFKTNRRAYQYNLKAFFCPEHGLLGLQHAEVKVLDSVDPCGIPIYSLHGDTRRPTTCMLNGINLLVFDIQDLGSRSYTYCTTLFYVMEEAAKRNIPVLVLDRPNPLGGNLVDGPMLEEKWRSFVGYVNVPYCHGLTIGELANFFNEEYHVGCQLKIVPMKNWQRSMTFEDTGLLWIPTSPHIPEANSPFYYPTTGLLGEMQLVNIGIGYTLPFKVIGAPWIDAQFFSQKLNEQQLPGVYFHPFHYTPFWGRFSGQDCHGTLIVIQNPKEYLPLVTQYLIIGMLKSLYPQEFQSALNASTSRYEMFNKVNGTAEVLKVIKEERYPFWKLKQLCIKQKEGFLARRQAYLIYQ